ncbi:MAG: hypothetical protein JSW56_08980 [Deltaproteobacteria bacterium]|nr:MAG: hypothetical protein JSW56_08980 [Deltaproteobacteria bacterium]
MKERLLDVLKWGLILIIAGAVFYVVCPKYQDMTRNRVARYNTITGKYEVADEKTGGWTDIFLMVEKRG